METTFVPKRLLSVALEMLCAVQAYGYLINNYKKLQEDEKEKTLVYDEYSSSPYYATFPQQLP
jgi:hypothetical protein